MSFKDTFTIIASIAVIVERVTEIFKPIYLKIKNGFMKTEQTECTKLEKTIITIIISPIVCLLMQFGIDIPILDEPLAVQQILAGMIASFGSNVLHITLSILTGIKDTTEITVRRQK